MAWRIRQAAQEAQQRCDAAEEQLRNALIELESFRQTCQRQAQEIRGYIEQDTVAGGKYRAKLEQCMAEIHLLRKAGLHSGCSCPIGVCLQTNRATDGECWVRWADAYVMKRRGEILIDELQTQARHPARIAAARSAKDPSR